MIRFAMKKTFFDLWDHLFRIALINVIGAFLMGVELTLLHLFNGNAVVSFIGAALSILLFSVFTGGVSFMTGEIADYRTPYFKEFLSYLKRSWKTAAAFGLIMVIQFVLFVIAFPWYANMGNMVGFAIAGLLFWGSIVWWLASQYYFPIAQRLHSPAKKSVLKCFMVFFDNIRFSIVVGLGTAMLLLISSLTAFMIPGIGVILLWHQVAFKLRLYKYDYLEAHPEADRRRIPWDDLLKDDRDRIGVRTLRGMIFPWKE